MRRAIHRPALGKIGPLLVPAPELEPATLEPIIKLRHGIGAFLGVQKGVGQRVGTCEVLRPFDHAGDRMVDGQRLNRLPKIAQVLVPDADSEQAAIVLHHSDAYASVRRVDHDVHRAVACEDVTQRPQTRVRIAQMVKHARANNLVEGLAEFPDPLDRKAVELQISDVVLVLKITGVTQACFAEIDRSHARFRLHERVPRSLRGPTSSNKNFAIRPWRLERPQQQVLGSATVRVAIAVQAFLERRNRRRVWMELVEGANRRRSIRRA